MKKWFLNMMLRKKLMLTFGVLIALFLAAEVVCVFSITSVRNSMRGIYNDQFQVVSTSHQLSIDLQKYAKELARLGVANLGREDLTAAENQAYLQEKSAATQTNFAAVGADLDALAELGVTDQAALETMQNAYTQLQGYTDEVMRLYSAGDVYAAISMANNELDSAGKVLGDTMELLIVAEQNEMDAALNSADLLVQELYIVTIVLAVLVVLFCVFMGILLTRSVAAPLQEVESVAERLSHGDLHQELTYESGDELGSLARSIRATSDSLDKYVKVLAELLRAIGDGDLRTMAAQDVEFEGDFLPLRESMETIRKNLTDIIAQINISADQVLRGAEQIAASGQSMSQAALEQASSVEELGETINDISNQIQNTAENAMTTSDLTQTVSGKMASSLRQMEELQSYIGQMRERSDKVSAIISEIEDISFQTNILSLNAAVEAARAGEAGRGFSVVANEIRRLSVKTSDASKMTRDMLSQTIQMTQDSARMAAEVGEALSESADAAQDAAGKVELISQVSSEQAAAIVQIRQSIEMISSVVQENSATAEESAASSEELTGQMQLLKDLVSTFRYQEETPADRR